MNGEGDGGREKGLQLAKERGCLTHNAQLEGLPLGGERAWERLKAKQLNSFLAELNEKGGLSLTKGEVRFLPHAAACAQ
jgi:hypothetical protein